MGAAPPPPRLEYQISDLEVWVTGDVADRVLMSVRDVYLPCRTIPDTKRVGMPSVKYRSEIPSTNRFQKICVDIVLRSKHVWPRFSTS